MVPDLRLVPMPTDAAVQKRQTRTAWWLRVCHLVDSRKPTGAQVAVAAGLSAGSASVVSLWEQNKAQPKLEQLERLAAFYGVPVSLFTEPPETDEERLGRYRQRALAAVDAEQRDWDEAVAGGRTPGVERASSPRRRSA